MDDVMRYDFSIFFYDNIRYFVHRQSSGRTRVVALSTDDHALAECVADHLIGHASVGDNAFDRQRFEKRGDDPLHVASGVDVINFLTDTATNYLMYPDKRVRIPTHPVAKGFLDAMLRAVSLPRLTEKLGDLEHVYRFLTQPVSDGDFIGAHFVGAIPEFFPGHAPHHFSSTTWLLPSGERLLKCSDDASQVLRGLPPFDPFAYADTLLLRTIANLKHETVHLAVCHGVDGPECPLWGMWSQDFWDRDHVPHNMVDDILFDVTKRLDGFVHQVIAYRNPHIDNLMDLKDALRMALARNPYQGALSEFGDTHVLIVYDESRLTRMQNPFVVLPTIRPRMHASGRLENDAASVNETLRKILPVQNGDIERIASAFMETDAGPRIRSDYDAQRAVMKKIRCDNTYGEMLR